MGDLNLRVRRLTKKLKAEVRFAVHQASRAHLQTRVFGRSFSNLPTQDWPSFRSTRRGRPDLTDRFWGSCPVPPQTGSRLSGMCRLISCYPNPSSSNYSFCVTLSASFSPVISWRLADCCCHQMCHHRGSSRPACSAVWSS